MLDDFDSDPFGSAPVVPVPARARRKKEPEPQPQPAGYTGPIEFVIYGEPASKANSRELATIGPKDARRTIFRKSDKALEYEKNALRQIPPRARLQLQVRVAVTLRIFYATERPDLDESVILDVLQNRYAKVKETGQRVLVQAGVYVNDRQVREKHVYWGLDRLSPRAEIRIESISPQGGLL